jgi:thiol-disulfide isomerase/thioredoxin
MKSIIIACLIFLIMLGLALEKVLERHTTIKPTSENNSPAIPSAYLLTTSGEQRHSSSFDRSKTLIINYFSTSCDFCEAEFTALIESSTTANVHVILMSQDSLAELKSLHQYFTERGMKQYEQLTIAHISKETLLKFFPRETMPQTIIYKDGRQVFYQEGLVTFTLLQHEISKSH